GRARRRHGDHAAAAADLRRSIALRERLGALNADTRFDLARNHALLAGLALESDSGLSAADGRAEADRAMTVLKDAVASGFREPKLVNDPDLAPLHPRPDFQLLMMDLAFPTDPFAR